MVYSLIFLVVFLMSFTLTPMVRKIAISKNFFDQPGELRIHKQAVPLLGGVAVLIAMIAGILATGHRPQATGYRALWGVIAGGGLVFVVGLWDDVKSVKPIVRLLMQVLAGVIVILAGIRVNFIPIAGIAIPLTLFYIVGAINAFNVIDGMDGLCAGISLVGCVGFFFLGLNSGNMFLMLLSSVLFMSLLGFLPYNFHPAKIFLGDAGSGFLGFMLGVMAVMATSKPYSMTKFIAPILVVSVPVLDMAFAILRRLIRKKVLFIGDRNHTYDLLLKKGMSHPKVWSVVCGAQLAMVGIALFVF